MPDATQLSNVASSLALGAAEGFGGITPLFRNVTDNAPTVCVESVVAFAVRFA
jgi:hypothetical protein